MFHATWHELPAACRADGIDWAALIALRTDVTRELEKLRDTRRIGAPLDARVDVYCPPAEHARFAALGAELRFLLDHLARRTCTRSRPHRRGRCRR